MFENAFAVGNLKCKQSYLITICFIVTHSFQTKFFSLVDTVERASDFPHIEANFSKLCM